MNYRLVWPIPLLNRLEDEYRRAREAGQAAAFTSAVHSIEQAITADPLACGESRGGTIRLIVEAPVAVWYEANHALMSVTVHDVRYYPRRAR